MTISTTASSQTFLGNGVITAFSFAFVADSSSYISVIYTDSTGTSTTIPVSQYTLFVNPPAVGQIWGVGGTVTYPLVGSPIANGTSLTISRTLPFQQLVSIANQGDFAPAVIEEGLDSLEMQIQQVWAVQGRAISIPVTDPSTLITTLPSSAARAGEIISFDANGNVITIPAQVGPGADLSSYTAKATGATTARTLAAHFADKLSVRDFGITGSGDEGALFTTALSTAATAGVMLDGEGLTISFGTSIIPTAMPSLFNVTLNSTAAGAVFNPTGTLGSALTPVGSLAAGDTTITFAVNTGYARGDLLFIISADVWSTASGDGEITSQWATVLSTASGGTVVTLQAPLDYAFTTSINVYKPTTLNDMYMEKVAFTGLGLNNAQILFQPSLCKNFNFVDIKGTNSGNSHVTLDRCYNVKGYGMELNGAFSAGSGYGLAIGSGCENVEIFGVTGGDVRHLVTQAGVTGVNRNCRIYGIEGDGCRDAIADCHPSSDMAYYEVSGNNTSANLETVVMQGARGEVKIGTITGAQGSIVIQPYTNLPYDWHRITTGYQLNYAPGTAGFALVVDNKKATASIDFITIDLSTRNLDTSGECIKILNEAVSDINAVTIRGNMRSANLPMQIRNTSTGKIKNVNIEGYVENTGSSQRVIQIQANAVGDIDNVNINARLVGGDYAIQNVSNNATNVRANFSLITGQTNGIQYPGAAQTYPSPFSGGSTYLATKFSVTSSTTLVDVTGMSIPVDAFAIYSFRAEFPVTSGASGGVKAAIAGTSTSATFTASAWTYNTTTTGAQNTVAAQGQALGTYTQVATNMVITGSIHTLTAGTIAPQFAQSVSDATPSSVNVGATFTATKIG